MLLKNENLSGQNGIKIRSHMDRDYFRNQVHVFPEDTSKEKILYKCRRTMKRYEQEVKTGMAEHNVMTVKYGLIIIRTDIDVCITFSCSHHPHSGTCSVWHKLFSLLLKTINVLKQ